MNISLRHLFAALLVCLFALPSAWSQNEVELTVTISQPEEDGGDETLDFNLDTPELNTTDLILANQDFSNYTIVIPKTVLPGRSFYLDGNGSAANEGVGVLILQEPAHGTLHIASTPSNPDVGITYTPDPGFSGNDSFTYTTGFWANTDLLPPPDQEVVLICRTNPLDDPPLDCTEFEAAYGNIDGNSFYGENICVFGNFDPSNIVDSCDVKVSYEQIPDNGSGSSLRFFGSTETYRVNVRVAGQDEGVLYDHLFFTGESKVFEPGYYPDLTSAGFLNDRVTSLWVGNNTMLIAHSCTDYIAKRAANYEVYNQPGNIDLLKFWNTNGPICPNEDLFGAAFVNNSFKSVSILKKNLQPEPDQVVFYQNSNFTGGSLAVDLGAYSSLAQVDIPYNFFKSVRVGGLAELTLFADPGFNGATLAVAPGQGAPLTGFSGFDSLQVESVNFPPIVSTPLSNLYLNEDDDAHVYSLDQYFFDPDNDALTYSIESNTDSSVVNATVNGSTLIVDPQHDQSGSSTITVKAADTASQSVSDSFTVTVSPVNDAPVAVGSIADRLLSIADAGAYDPADVLIDLNGLFSDIDDSSFTYAAQSSNPALLGTQIAGSVLELAPVNLRTGSALVTALAQDDEGETAGIEFSVVIRDFDVDKNGVPDDNEENVKTFENEKDGQYVTVYTKEKDKKIKDAKVKPEKDLPPKPKKTSFPVGAFEFKVEGVTQGGQQKVIVDVPKDKNINTYFMYGPTPENPNDHWYEFTYDGATGAIVHSGTIELFFEDGGRGDHDQSANGVIVDPGAPAYVPVPATYTVANAASSGPGSLRQAVLDANSNPADDIIVFDASLSGQTISLGGSPLQVSGVLTINGPGAGALSVSAGGSSRVIEIANGASLEINGLTIRDGFTPAQIGGGGILNNGTLTLNECVVRNNQINNTGATGAGLWSGGTLNVNRCLFIDNDTNFAGPGSSISQFGGVGTIVNSTFTGNRGNCIFQLFGSMTLLNNTIYANTGLGIENRSSDPIVLTNSIVAANQPGGAIFADLSGRFHAENNLIGKDPADTNIFTALPTNINNQFNVDPLVGPLQYNGGPTPTFALLSGSPALNAGKDLSASGVIVDQRGVARPQGSAFDIGAVEIENQPPVAVADLFELNEDASLAFSVTANDSDPENDALSVAEFTQPVSGILIYDATSDSFVYTPNPDFNGDDSFTYAATDGFSTSNSVEVTLSVLPINDAPVAVDDSATTNEDTPIEIDVLANDSDIESDALVIDEIVSVGNGSAAITSAGTLLFTPDPDFFGFGVIEYVIADDGSGDPSGSALTSNIALVSVKVIPVNDPPVAINDSASVDEDQSVTIDVLANDYDIDSPIITVVSTANAKNGSVVINADDTITFTPDPDFNGKARFDYTITDKNKKKGTKDGSDKTGGDKTKEPDDGKTKDPVDKKTKEEELKKKLGAKTATATTSSGGGSSETATVWIDVNPVNDAPFVASSIGSATVAEDSAPYEIDLSGVFGDVDIDTNDDALTLAAASDTPALASPAISGATLSVTPQPDQFGAAVISVTAIDSEGAAVGTAFVFTVLPVNDAPSFRPGGDIIITEGSIPQSNLWALDLSAGPANESGQALSFSTSNDAPGLFAAEPALASDGTLTFEDLSGPNGTAIVTAILSDDGGTELGGIDESVPAQFSITIENVSPIVITNTLPLVANEGSELTLQAFYMDPGFLDTHTAAIDWEPGAFLPATVDASLESVSGSFAYLDDVETEAVVIVTDNDGGVGSATQAIQVLNVAPSVETGPDYAVDEGSSISFDLGFSDPGVLDTHTASIDWGDGSSGAGTIAGGRVSGSHVYLDDGVYTVTVTVADDDGGIGESVFAVTVNNVAPICQTLAGLPLDPVGLGASVSLTLGFSDPGVLDTHLATIAWGDGAVDTVAADGSSVIASHTYVEAGIYAVTVTLADDDGGACATAFEDLVVIDTGEGFAKGAGQISFNGKAKFEFNAKYKGKDNKLKSEASFKAAGIHFKSKRADWLMENDEYAILYGTGVVKSKSDDDDGDSDTHGFIITGIDASLVDGLEDDLFRIQIWDLATGETLVDTLPGERRFKAIGNIVTRGKVQLKDDDKKDDDKKDDDKKDDDKKDDDKKDDDKKDDDKKDDDKKDDDKKDDDKKDKGKKGKKGKK